MQTQFGWEATSRSPAQAMPLTRTRDSRGFGGAKLSLFEAASPKAGNRLQLDCQGTSLPIPGPVLLRQRAGERPDLRRLLDELLRFSRLQFAKPVHTAQAPRPGALMGAATSSGRLEDRVGEEGGGKGFAGPLRACLLVAAS